MHFHLPDDVGQALADSLNKAGLPGQVLFVKCDVTKIEDIKVGQETALRLCFDSETSYNSRDLRTI